MKNINITEDNKFKYVNDNLVFIGHFETKDNSLTKIYSNISDLSQINIEKTEDNDFDIESVEIVLNINNAFRTFVYVKNEYTFSLFFNNMEDIMINKITTSAIDIIDKINEYINK